MLQGLDPDASDEEEAPVDSEVWRYGEEEKTPPPFEALFVPDYSDRISLIAPQIAFYGLEDIQLLGTNGWNDAELPRLARQFVEGAVFTDSFFLHSSYPFVQEFVEDYFNRFGEEPTILEAQGYDIAGIMLTLLNDPGITQPRGPSPRPVATAELPRGDRRHTLRPDRRSRQDPLSAADPERCDRSNQLGRHRTRQTQPIHEQLQAPENHSSGDLVYLNLHLDYREKPFTVKRSLVYFACSAER